MSSSAVGFKHDVKAVFVYGYNQLDVSLFLRMSMECCEARTFPSREAKEHCKFLACWKWLKRVDQHTLISLRLYVRNEYLPYYPGMQKLSYQGKIFEDM